ncbi:MAG: histidine kinase [Clostridium sp.]
MIFRKHDSLKKTYYRSFFGLIVVPILLIFIISLSIVNVMIRNAAIVNIQNMQGSITSALTENIREASLQLSHFVYVNDGELVKTAAESDTADTGARYSAEKSLDRLFQTTMAPGQRVISGMIYMKNRRNTYLKDEIVIPMSEIRTADWYAEALKEPNIVKVGSYDTTVSHMTYSRLKRREFIIVTALSPDNFVDRSSKIEMIALFSTAQAGAQIKNYNRKQEGTTVILDANGHVIYGNFEQESADQIIGELDVQHVGVSHQTINAGEGKRGRYTLVVSDVEGSGWRIATYVKTAALTAKFGKIAWMVLLVLIILMMLFYLFSKYFLKNIIEPVQTMVEGLKEVEDGNLNTRLEPSGQSEIRNMLHSFNRTVRRLKASTLENEEIREKKHLAEMQALQSQINPHFLVNSLNSIRFMAQVSKYDGIRKMAEAMIKILTCSFRSNLSFYTVKEELEVLDSFVYLMKIRYSNGFDITYQVEPSCLNFEIPRLILQPIVENSIVHGFEDMGEDMGHLELTVYREDTFIYFEIKDNGKGMTAEEVDHLLHPKERAENDNYSIGIENVYNRLKLNFKENCDMKIESELGSYTKTIIKLPIIPEGGTAE